MYKNLFISLFILLILNAVSSFGRAGPYYKLSLSKIHTQDVDREYFPYRIPGTQLFGGSLQAFRIELNRIHRIAPRKCNFLQIK